MPFLKSKFWIILALASSLASANSNTKLNDNIVAPDRLKLFDLSDEQTKENSEKLKKDWINPITYKYSKVYGESYDTEKSYISIDQPIFKTGGIYMAIKYATALRKYTHLDIDAQRKALIRDTTILLFNINKLDFSIKKQMLLVQNGQIDIQRKKEQVLNGFADTSVLDNAILDTNTRKNTLADLKYQREELINSFNNVASGAYTSFTLPTVTMLEKDNFIKQNLNIKKTKANIETKDNYASITIAKYLPTVGATFNYTKYHTTDSNPSYTRDEVQNYGIYISMPLDVRTFNDVQSKRIDYLKAKMGLTHVILEENNFFKSKLAKIKMLNEKENIAQEDFKLYNDLLEVIIQEKEAEIKTQSDVDTLLNSKNIKSLEIEIYKIEKQIELLEIYAKLG